MASMTTLLSRRFPRQEKQYSAGGFAGCVQIRKVRETGTQVGVYHGVQSGIESDPATPWVTLCHEHTACVCHKTLANAKEWAATPSMWCEECQKAVKAKK